MSNVVSVMVSPMLDDIPKLRKLVSINQQELREAAQIAIHFADMHGMEYYTPAAGLYIWIRLLPNCSSWDEEEDAVRRCTQQSVSVGSGADYAELSPGWFRLTFAVTRSDLLLGLRRIEEALEYKQRFADPGVVGRQGSAWSWKRWFKISLPWSQTKKVCER